MLCDKGSDRVRVVGGGYAVGFKPLQYPPRTLEPRGVHQGVEGLAVHFQRIGLSLAGGAGFQGNGDGIVL